MTDTEPPIASVLGHLARGSEPIHTLRDFEVEARALGATIRSYNRTGVVHRAVLRPSIDFESGLSASASRIYHPNESHSHAGCWDLGCDCSPGLWVAVSTDGRRRRVRRGRRWEMVLGPVAVRVAYFTKASPTAWVDADLAEKYRSLCRQVGLKTDGGTKWGGT